MKVVVAADAISGLTPAQSSETIAHAFAARGAQVAVVPLGVSGESLAQAAAVAAPGVSFAAAHTPEAMAELLSDGAAEGGIVIDLTQGMADDLGRGVLARIASSPAAALEELRRRWAGAELVALVAPEQVLRPLTGLEGHASTVLRAAGSTLEEILAFESEAERWAADLGLEMGPGAGAAGGLGMLVTALGGRILDPLTWLAERYSLAATIGQADLVVTGAELVEFHEVGGPVVKQVVAWAGEQLRPVIALAGRNYVSARELRVAGLEATHSLREGAVEEPSTPEELAAAAGRVAASWVW